MASSSCVRYYWVSSHCSLLTFLKFPHLLAQLSNSLSLIFTQLRHIYLRELAGHCGYGMGVSHVLLEQDNSDLVAPRDCLIKSTCRTREPYHSLSWWWPIVSIIYQDTSSSVEITSPRYVDSWPLVSKYFLFPLCLHSCVHLGLFYSGCLGILRLLATTSMERSGVCFRAVI